MKTHKRHHERVEKTSISLPPRLYDFAESRVRALGYSSRSQYLQELIRRDAASAAALNPAL